MDNKQWKTLHAIWWDCSPFERTQRQYHDLRTANPRICMGPCYQNECRCDGDSDGLLKVQGSDIRRVMGNFRETNDRGNLRRPRSPSRVTLTHMAQVAEAVRLFYVAQYPKSKQDCRAHRRLAVRLVRLREKTKRRSATWLCWVRNLKSDFNTFVNKYSRILWSSHPVLHSLHILLLIWNYCTAWMSSRPERLPRTILMLLAKRSNRTDFEWLASSPA